MTVRNAWNKVCVPLRSGFRLEPRIDAPASLKPNFEPGVLQQSKKADQTLYVIFGFIRQVNRGR